MMKYLIFYILICLTLLCQTDTYKQENSLNDISTFQEIPYSISFELKREYSKCANDMVHVEGNYCPEVQQKCLSWLDEDKSSKSNFGIGPLRCASFAPTKCLSSKKERKNFCIDVFEWANKKGQYPIVDIDWNASKKKCEDIGKRLCTSSEWTFACEGEEMKPYPYGNGLERDEAICDQRHESMNPSLPRSEWSKYYFAHPSGSFPLCKSSFVVYDMTANVDEWIRNESGKPFISGLKGGYWTYKVRTRCRPMTDAHGPQHSFYQQGFRCCSDSKN